jgi:predicted DNA-binding protein (UPF0251 family)
MARPRKIRTIGTDVGFRWYKPQGIPLRDLDETVVTLDGLEALRLADVEGLDQTTAAERMGISRSTFSRLLAEARNAVATALCEGTAIRIEGGPVTVAPGGCRRHGGPGPGGRRCRADRDPKTNPDVPEEGDSQ